MTLHDFLSSCVAADIPDAFLDSLSDELHITLSDEREDVPAELVNAARARIYLFLATVPNVTEGGVSISYSAADKKIFLDQARRFAKLAGDTDLVPGADYGYKGQNL